ncbi:uncharacterized protein LOC132611755 [Lycium barbarum]|uniref:uncharacterized protein LOC132611755 n=1 Tax=Lycium barbarum TaxID=112863 RepID=UPI00293F3045|nr:uncharacterized protein LOC132611755 [Lycium barbarum]
MAQVICKGDIINGLKILIRQESQSAHSMHCFSHQLQLNLVAVSKICVEVGKLVVLVSNILMGLHQELGLARSGDTYWGSHYKSFSNFILMFGSILDVLESLVLVAHSSDERAKAKGYLRTCQTIEDVFMLHLMRNVLGITNELNKCLEKKEQDITNAKLLVELSVFCIEYEKIPNFDELSVFCIEYEKIPNFDESYVSSLRSRRKHVDYTISHHYRLEVFHKITDWQLQEFDNPFGEVAIDLLHGIACMVALDNKLASYIVDVRDVNERFSNLNRFCNLSKRLVQTKKHSSYPFVFCLKLSLLTLVATTSAERASSAMKFTNNYLWSRMSDVSF